MNIFFLIILGWLFLLAYEFSEYKKNVGQVPYSEFLTYVDQGKLDRVLIDNETVTGVFKVAPPDRPREFVTQRPDDPQLVNRLQAAHVPFSAIHPSTLFKDILSWTLPAIIFVGLWVFAISRMGQGQRGGGPGGVFPSSRSRARVYVEKGLKTRFEDVAGVDEAKEELREVVNFLKDPKRYSKLGGRMPKGVLLVGAPGTGKTLLARAVAGEAGVPFFSINGSEFVELFVGLGAARVRDLFEQARHHSPCIVFIDELDALGKARSIGSVTGASNDEKEQTLNQLLAELDGFDPSSGIVLVAATNRPEVLDPALLRAGRFDRQIVVDKPDRKGREQILSVHLKKVKVANEVIPDALASLTAGFSGADLANVVNEAALIATRRGAESVESHDFSEAIERTVAGLARRSRLISPIDKRRVAFHEMGHAVVALAMGEGHAVHKVSVIPRGIGALGYTFQRPLEDRYLMSKSELEARLAMMLGGRASEMIFFEDISTGAADDLEKATDIARAMITRYGMGGGLGLATLEREVSPMLGGGLSARNFPYSEHTAQAVDAEIRRMLSRALALATYTVKKHRSMVEEAAQILLVNETLDEDELRRLWEKQIERKVSAADSEVQGETKEGELPPHIRRIGTPRKSG